MIKTKQSETNKCSLLHVIPVFIYTDISCAGYTHYAISNGYAAVHK